MFMYISIVLYCFVPWGLQLLLCSYTDIDRHRQTYTQTETKTETETETVTRTHRRRHRHRHRHRHRNRHKHKYRHRHIQPHTQAQAQTQTYTYTHTHRDTYMHICIRIQVYIYTYIHTHNNTHTKLQIAGQKGLRMSHTAGKALISFYVAPVCPTKCHRHPKRRTWLFSCKTNAQTCTASKIVCGASIYTPNKAGQRAQHTHQESTCHTQNAEHLQACCSCTPPAFSGRRHTVLVLISLDAKDYNGLPLANCNAHGRCT